MSDFLLELGQNRRARRLIKSLGLPLPMPQALRRADEPWEERPLHDYDIAAGFAPGAALTDAVASTLCSSGANPFASRDEVAAFGACGAAFGRPATAVDFDAIADGQRFHGLVFDATGVATTGGLRALYDFFHPLVGSLGTSSRAVVLGRPPESCSEAEAASAQAALTGFVRSLGRELGRKGSTANLLYVDTGAEDRAAGALRFLLSARSAFVSGQVLRVTCRVETADHAEYVHSLEGKVALVTGAARGIGEATARLLADEGAHVVCLDRPGDDQLVSQVARDVGGSVLLADVSSLEAPAQIAEHLKARHNGVDVVVHNAGVTRDKTLAKMAPALWDQAVDINLGAVARITAALTGGALLRDDGRIVCLSSVAGIAGNMGQTNYSASKAGIIGFVEQQAGALAPRGISVNAIAPGFIETRLTAAIPVMIREAGRRLSNLGQGGAPRDVGEAITFLASPAAAGITGTVIRVCGGAFIGA